MASAEARAYNGGLGTEPPAGVQGAAPQVGVRGRSPPEAGQVGEAPQKLTRFLCLKRYFFQRICYGFA